MGWCFIPFCLFFSVVLFFVFLSLFFECCFFSVFFLVFLLWCSCLENDFSSFTSWGG